MKLQDMATVIREVFVGWRYRFTCLIVVVVFILLEIWLAHYSLINFTFRADAFSWKDKAQVLLSTIEMFVTVFPRDIQILTVLTAILVGINCTVLLYYLRRRVRTLRATGSSFIGIGISLLGAGCSACGSVLLSSLIGFGAATNALTVLPLRGKEFSLIAMSILIFSTYWIIKKIASPPVCQVKY